ETHRLLLPHPTEPGVEMQLNAWDFGGQDILHATHQFFLTPNSLYLLVWKTREGYEGSQMQYWLDTIQAKAPGASVIIVATHVDQWPANLPKSELEKKYPNIRGFFE